tara:strand:+ start:914 stop:1237 length:324 start_codon:yes stop_codon:yes gene_type:complete
LALINRYRTALDGGKSLCLCVSFSTSLESWPPDVITQISSFRAMLISWLKVTLEVGKSDGTIAGVESLGQEAAAILTLLECAQLPARAEENSDSFDKAMQLLANRLC